ncbi:MAG: LON peptidase substrate-binding domain-containing protein [Pirellulales bacterium]|nr:LON peptidase substrate-binding domain-containing protein [Pirellulales bacterium]HCK41901.1 ATP-dependent protease [Planctomycetaceae bacterium]
MLPWDVDDLTFDETRFRGKVRLFPLPDLVMYPHVMQPLNIFEPRYLELLNEALDSDGLIAMSVLNPGKKMLPTQKTIGHMGPQSTDRPEVLPHACLGKVVTHQRKENGQYNILVLGMRRVTIHTELPPERSFRQAEVNLLDDFCRPENDTDRADLQAALTQRFQECLPEEQSAHPALSEMLSTEIPLSVLTDLVSFAMPFNIETKCELLRENDVDRRAWILLEAMDRLPNPEPQQGSQSGYLPPFSEN